jgi:hypothetical protein
MMFLCWLFFALLFSIPPLIGMWKTYVKAGEPGWSAIVPIYNLMIMAKIAGKGEGHGLLIGLLMFVPCVNIVAIVLFIMLLMEFCNQFDVGGGFVVGLILLPIVFWPILGFGSARYLGSRRRAYDDDRPRKRRPRPVDEYEEEDRPRKRRRYDDDDDDEPRPRKPRRDDDDDDDEPRIRKPRRDDY